MGTFFLPFLRLDNARKAERYPAALGSFQRWSLQMTVLGSWLPKWRIPLGSNAVLIIWNAVVGTQMTNGSWNGMPKLFVEDRRGPLLHRKRNGGQHDAHILQTATLNYFLHGFLFFFLVKVGSKQWRNIPFFFGEML